MQAYPLTALQKGMLFHSLSYPSSGVDIEQIAFTLNEPLNIDLFVRAWERVIERYPVLRTRFVLGSTDDVVQYFVPEVAFCPELLDWSNQSIDEQTLRFSGLQKSDRLKDFNMSAAPLLRLTLIKLGEACFRGLWTFHHAILDGRSFPIVLTDVFNVYENLLNNTDFNLEPVTSFGDYIEWQQGLDFENSKAYWQNKLEGYTAPAEIGFRAHRQNEESFEVDAIEQNIDASAASRITAFAKAEGVTLHTLLQAVWALILHHYSGEEDIAFGSTRANRYATIPGAQDIVGLLINTVPVRTLVEDGKPLSEFLKALRQQHIEFREHEQTPLPLIRNWSEMVAGKPLFETLVVFENYLLNTRLKSQGGSWENREFSYQGQTNFPLTLIGYADKGLVLRLEFRVSHFSSEFAAALLKHTCNLLSQFPAWRDTPIKEIPYLDTTEEQRLLEQSRALQSGAIAYNSVSEKFEAIVSNDPDAVAVKFEDSELTYLQLNRVANKIAFELINLGTKPGDLVGLCVDRSLHTVMSILGILKAGAAYVPMDPNYPREHLEYIIEDARLPVVVTSSQNQLNIENLEIKVFPIDHIDVAAVIRDTKNDPSPTCNINADHHAYVIYTSGSTGKPKGVLVTHRNVLRLFNSTNSLYEFNNSDVWTLFHSYAFDFSVWEIWGALLYGGKLVIVPYWISRSPEDFYRLLVQERVTVLNQTPGAFRQLSNVEDVSGANPSLKLRYVIFGGEALDFASLQEWFGRHGEEHPMLINMYGITETTVHVTYRRVTQSDIYHSKGSLIGRPIPDLSLHLLNDTLHPVPPGVPGEMYVGGAGVADGYLNREELTRERFISNPFAHGDDSNRLYKTGDMGRYQFDGELEYIGRSDLQVKIRGFRIELGEIESKLSAHSAIIENTVIVREDIPGDKRIVAYYVCPEASTLTSQQVREFLGHAHIETTEI